MKKLLAVGLIAAGLVIGGSTTAHAVTASPYVTVLWSYDGYPDLTKPQPFVGSAAGADLHVFDATLAQADSCGHAFQVDVYKVTDEHGRSWETLKESGSLQYAHDGGFLAYDAGVGTPYRVITPEEYPCAPASTPTPVPTTSPTPVTSPSPSATTTPTPPSSSPTPSASSSPTPSASSSPTAPATATPSASPSPAAPTPASPSPSASVAPKPTPSSSTSASPTATATPSAVASVTSSTPSGPQARELAYTGANPWLGIGAASVLVVAGIVLLVTRRVRRG